MKLSHAFTSPEQRNAASLTKAEVAVYKLLKNFNDNPHIEYISTSSLFINRHKVLKKVLVVCTLYFTYLIKVKDYKFYTRWQNRFLEVRDLTETNDDNSTNKIHFTSLLEVNSIEYSTTSFVNNICRQDANKKKEDDVWNDVIVEAINAHEKMELIDNINKVIERAQMNSKVVVMGASDAVGLNAESESWSNTLAVNDNEFSSTSEGNQAYDRISANRITNAESKNNEIYNININDNTKTLTGTTASSSSSSSSSFSSSSSSPSSSPRSFIHLPFASPGALPSSHTVRSKVAKMQYRTSDQMLSADANRLSLSQLSALSSLVETEFDDYTALKNAFIHREEEKLLSDLSKFISAHEVELEELCRDHYPSFVHAAQECLSISSNDASLVGKELSGAAHLVRDVVLQLKSIASSLLHSRNSVEHLMEVRGLMYKALHMIELLETVESSISRDRLMSGILSLRELVRQVSSSVTLRTGSNNTGSNNYGRESSNLLTSGVLGEYTLQQRLPALLSDLFTNAVQQMYSWLQMIRINTPVIGRSAFAWRGRVQPGYYAKRLVVMVNKPNALLQKCYYYCHRTNNTLQHSSHHNISDENTFLLFTNGKVNDNSHDENCYNYMQPNGNNYRKTNEVSGEWWITENYMPAVIEFFDFDNAEMLSGIAHGARLQQVFHELRQDEFFINTYQRSRAQQIKADLLEHELSECGNFCGTSTPSDNKNNRCNLFEEYTYFMETALGVILVEDVLYFATSSPHLNSTAALLHLWNEIAEVVSRQTHNVSQQLLTLHGSESHQNVCVKHNNDTTMTIPKEEECCTRINYVYEVQRVLQLLRKFTYYATEHTKSVPLSPLLLSRTAEKLTDGLISVWLQESCTHYAQLLLENTSLFDTSHFYSLHNNVGENGVRNTNGNTNMLHGGDACSVIWPLKIYSASEYACKVARFYLDVCDWLELPVVSINKLSEKMLHGQEESELSLESSEKGENVNLDHKKQECKTTQRQNSDIDINNKCEFIVMPFATFVPIVGEEVLNFLEKCYSVIGDAMTHVKAKGNLQSDNDNTSEWSMPFMQSSELNNMDDMMLKYISVLFRTVSESLHGALMNITFTAPPLNLSTCCDNNNNDNYEDDENDDECLDTLELYAAFITSCAVMPVLVSNAEQQFMLRWNGSIDGADNNNKSRSANANNNSCKLADSNFHDDYNDDYDSNSDDDIDDPMLCGGNNVYYYTNITSDNVEKEEDDDDGDDDYSEGIKQDEHKILHLQEKCNNMKKTKYKNVCAATCDNFRVTSLAAGGKESQWMMHSRHNREMLGKPQLLESTAALFAKPMHAAIEALMRTYQSQLEHYLEPTSKINYWVNQVCDLKEMLLHQQSKLLPEDQHASEATSHENTWQSVTALLAENNTMFGNTGPGGINQNILRTESTLFANNNEDDQSHMNKMSSPLQITTRELLPLSCNKDRIDYAMQKIMKKIPKLSRYLQLTVLKSVVGTIMAHAGMLIQQNIESALQNGLGVYYAQKATSKSPQRNDDRHSKRNHQPQSPSQQCQNEPAYYVNTNNCDNKDINGAKLTDFRSVQENIAPSEIRKSWMSANETQIFELMYDILHVFRYQLSCNIPRWQMQLQELIPSGINAVQRFPINVVGTVDDLTNWLARQQREHKLMESEE